VFNAGPIVKKKLWFVFVYSVGEQGKVVEELKRADSVIVTYACDDTMSFERVSTHWLPQLQKLEVGDWVCLFCCHFQYGRKIM